MALPVPNLDDRRFQDLVDDAKRLVQQKCPEWTDHNVSDPGVTLIETFAWMTDQLIYRLNRVPDRNYVKFLELIGVNLFPPTAARSQVTFWLSAPQPDVVRIPTGTQVATVRTETDEAIVFATVDDLPIVPSSLAELGSMIDGKAYRDHWGALEKASGFTCFKDTPAPGDALLRRAVGGRAVERRAAALQLPHRGRRRRPQQPAARLGGVERRRLGAVRARLGLDRRPQPRRRRRRPRPEVARRVARSRRSGPAGSGPGSRSRSRASPRTARRRRSRASPRSRSAGRPRR